MSYQSNKKGQAVQTQQVLKLEKQSLHIGPLPSPEQLQQYEIAVEGSAREIIEWAKAEQTHRHEMERAYLDLEKKARHSTNWNIIRGQLLAFMSVLVSTGLCGYFAYLGNVEAASDAAKWVIASLAAVFITGQFKQKQLPTSQ